MSLPYALDSENTLIRGKYGLVIYNKAENRYIPVAKDISWIDPDTLAPRPLDQLIQPARQLAEGVSVRKGTAGKCDYLYYRVGNRGRPQFIALDQFAGNPWTAVAADLIAYALPRLK